MPKPSIRILVSDKVHPDPAEMSLCVDVGDSHMTFALLRKSEGRLLGFESYTLNPHSRQDDVEEILRDSPFLKIPFENACLTYNTPEAVLVPGSLHEPSNAGEVVSLIHGDMPSGIILQEHVPGADMYNVYRVPGWLHRAVTARFSNGEYWHAYSALLKSIGKRRIDWQRTFLYLWFFPTHVIVTLLKDDRLMLMQSFPYETPEDLSYQMLNIVGQFDLDISGLQIYMSGLIDKDSIIHDEIMKYFLNLETDPGGPLHVHEEVFANYPLHYFTSSLSLCPCGS
jgi:hypothetical protein